MLAVKEVSAGSCGGRQRGERCWRATVAHAARTEGRPAMRQLGRRQTQEVGSFAEGNAPAFVACDPRTPPSVGLNDIA